MSSNTHFPKYLCRSAAKTQAKHPFPSCIQLFVPLGCSLIVVSSIQQVRHGHAAGFFFVIHTTTDILSHVIPFLSLLRLCSVLLVNLACAFAFSIISFLDRLAPSFLLFTYTKMAPAPLSKVRAEENADENSMLQRLLISHDVFVSFSISLSCPTSSIGIYLMDVSLLQSNKRTPRLHVDGAILGYQRALRTQNTHVSLIKIKGCDSKEDADFYVGKRVAYITKAADGEFRVNWGKVCRRHGSGGVVRCRFRRNLPPQAIGNRVRVMLYPSNI